VASVKPATQLPNADSRVIDDFGLEWSRFDQHELSDDERQMMFDGYFSVFPWEQLPPDAVGFDAGCGTGRWAVLVAPRVGHLHCVDPSNAIEIARKNLQGFKQCSFYRVTVDEMPFPDGSMDFGYSLGVLHHVPDTRRGIEACVRKLKQGAPFLVYLYYAFDNQPIWFHWMWRLSDVCRWWVCRLPFKLKYAVTQAIALLVYWPIARAANLLEAWGVSVHHVPLSAYRKRSFYSMRTDALDRFGTKLERRFTRAEIRTMMEQAGLKDVQFSPHVPFWCAVGVKK
jgi:ubiquinone/menaquinone biosynthesis C-methylase UbiE